MKLSGPQKNLLTPVSSEIGTRAHRLLDVRAHALPVGGDLAEGEVLRDAADLPRRADRLEEPDHQPADLLAEVAVRRGSSSTGHEAESPGIFSVMR